MTLDFSIPTVLSAIGIGLGIWNARRKDDKNYAQLEARVDLLWGFLLKRGVAEGLTSGMLGKESPLRLNVQLLDVHPEITGQVKAFYEAGGNKLSDIKLIEELERRWGTAISLLSAANGMTSGSMLAALAFFVRPEMEIFKQFETSHWHKEKGASAGM